MFSYADLALYNRHGRLTAVAEVRNKRGTSGAWAAKLRRNMLAHGEFPHVDFFLIVTPDRLYVWKGAGDASAHLQPAYEIDAEPIFQPYFERAGVAPGEVRGDAFELVAASWLGDLMRSEDHAEQSVNGERLLVASGFLDAVKDGRVEYEVAT